MSLPYACNMPDFIDPNQILSQLDLKKEMVAVDFGSGSGGWAIPLAQKLEQGRVFAVDVQEEPLSALESKAKLQGLSNIRKIVADVEKEMPGIATSSCDLVLMTNLLFQVEDKDRVFGEAKRILKVKGRILVVEWKEGAVLGPQEGKVSKEEAKDVAQDLGFRLEKEFEAGEYHYGLIFIKP